MHRVGREGRNGGSAKPQVGHHCGQLLRSHVAGTGIAQATLPTAHVHLPEQREASQVQPLLVLQAENKGMKLGSDLAPLSSTLPSLWTPPPIPPG